MARTVTEDDGPASKMAKYVPAELVTIATAYFAAFDPGRTTVWIVLLLGAVLNVLYLYSVAQHDDRSQPRIRFYALSALAFVMWSAATIEEVATRFGLDADDERAFVLLAAAFVLPLLDSFSLPPLGRRDAVEEPAHPHDGPIAGPVTGQ